MRVCSERMKQMQFGGLYEIFVQANKLESQGKKIIHMEIGRPDFDSPTFAKEFVKSALDKGEVHYTDINGIGPLRKAICDKEKRRKGLDYDPESEISVTAGACEAISCCMLALMDMGDEIIAPSPFFSAYPEQAIIAGVNLVEVPVKMSDNWQMRVEDIEEKITPKTKMLLINSPNNPAGYVLDRENLNKIADIAKKHDLIVISDECYDEFNYEDEHVSIATLPGMRERTLVVKSTSKSFSMTGWRIGYVLGPAEIIKYVNKVHQNFSTCATSFAQWGAVEAFNNGDEFIDNMVKEFKKRGDYFYDALSKIDGLEIIKPRGAFYAFPDISKLKITDKEFASFLMEEAGVVGVPGSAFGQAGINNIRFAYCRSIEEVQEAGEKIKLAVEKLMNK